MCTCILFPLDFKKEVVSNNSMLVVKFISFKIKMCVLSCYTPDSRLIMLTFFVFFFYLFMLPEKIQGKHIVVGLSVCLSVPNSCPAHNFVIWSWIQKLFLRNDHHIETMCLAQHLGHDSLHWRLRSQHNLAAKSCRPITLLFEVGF